MRDSRILMGMTITVEVIDPNASQKDIDDVFRYFTEIDNRFSTYKKNSEISRINRGEIKPKGYSKEMQEVFRLAQQTKQETNGYFDITKGSTIDPSGLVKGWAIYNAAGLLQKKSFKNFYVDAGGDVQVAGKNKAGEKWQIGIRNPFTPAEIVKVIKLTDQGIATSGSYVRGQHVYDPHHPEKQLDDIVSMTVVGPNVFEADRFATAAFAMQKEGILFLESKKDIEGYMIDKDGVATYTSGFERYV